MATIQLTSLDDATRSWIDAEARRTGVSVSTVIERLLQCGVVAERQAAQPQRYHDPDDLAGTWSAEEADAFREATASFAEIDSAIWK